MKKSTRLFVAVVAVFGMAAVGYGAASAAGTGSPMVPKPDVAPAQFVPHAGAGSSPRPPSRPDSVFVPIAACRMVNTATAGGKIRTTRSFHVVGSSGFSGQGGRSTGCGIPSTATAIDARMTAFKGTKGGTLTAYPTGGPAAPTILFYPKKSYVSTGATLKLASGSGPVLTVKNSGGPTELVIDVYGYYDEQIEGMIASDGSIYSGSNHIVSATVINPGVYKVVLDRDVTYCTPMVDTYSGKGVYGSAYGFAGNNIYVYTWYFSGTTHLEVNNSYYFYLTVTC